MAGAIAPVWRFVILNTGRNLPLKIRPIPLLHGISPFGLPAYPKNIFQAEVVFFGNPQLPQKRGITLSESTKVLNFIT
jgi:hypothetical protein